MYSFDPAINYGPNDAGVSAFSIAAVFLGVLIGSWLLGAIYGFIANSINDKDNQDKWKCLNEILLVYIGG